MLRFSHCLAVFLLAFATGAHARQSSPAAAAPQPEPVLRAQANLVLLDVVVTANNAPIHQLTKDKFHILDNGKPVQPTVFEEHSPTDAPVVEKALNLGPDVYSNLPAYNVGSAANVLLLDALNTPLSDQQYVRQQMLQYLANIPPGTRIAVFTLASRLRMVQGFTTDAGALASALKGKGGAQPSALLDPQTAQQLSTQTADLANQGAGQDSIASMQQFEADFTTFQTDQRVQMTLGAMQDLARYLRLVPGRKNLIWFSGSFPLSIYPDPAASNPFEAARQYTDQVRETDDILSAARVAVYPVDARGLMLLPSADASNSFAASAPAAASGGGGFGAGGGRGGSRRGSGGGARASARPSRSASSGTGQSAAAQADQKFLAQTAEEHFSMQQIAEETGGQPFLNTNGIQQAVAQAVANGSSYYTIGYVPQIKTYDGSLHRLKLTVDGGYQAAYRRGYFADDPLKAVVNPDDPHNVMQSAVELGTPPVSELLFKVRVAPAAAAPDASNPAGKTAAASLAKGVKGPLKLYELDYGVASHMLAFAPAQDGKQHARVEFAVIAFDRDGRRINSIDQNANFDLPPAVYEQAMRTGVPIRQQIELPTGQFALRIVVHDLGNARVGAVEVPVVVP